MSTILMPPEAASPAEERFILHDVSWETYEQLLSNYVDSSSPRFAYDRGVLEIMSPSSEHEELTEIITQLVYILAEEWGFEYRNFGRTTFKRKDMESGFEPDSCFYIQSIERISDVRHLDPAVHPPHDLVIEIITQLVYILAEEWGFEYRNFGRTTFKRKDMESGFEPDSCFYIQSIERISDVRHLDPAVH